MDDFELAKISLAKKVTQECADFLREWNEDGIDLQVTTVDSTMTTDSNGKSCFGKTLTVRVDTWNGEDEDDDE